MASVSKKGNGYYVKFSFQKQERKLYGFTDRRIAERTGEKIEDLKTSVLSGVESPELTAWKQKLATDSPAIYDKLQSWGLVPERVKVFTVKDMAELWEEQAQQSSERTQYKHERHGKRLIEYFGADRPAGTITTTEAQQFLHWFSTAKLDTRGKTPKTYSSATVGREIGNFKSVFGWAVKCGKLSFNPFLVLRGWEAKNEENHEYVPVENVTQILESMETLDTAESRKWKAIIALGRFAGCRGACDLCLLTWDRIRWSCAGEVGSVTLEGKTKRGTIPLAPVLEQALSDWFDVAPEGERVFPDVAEHSNTNTMLKKYARRADVILPDRKPWYNLRKSFCTDLMKATGTDLQTYSKLSRHSPKVGAEHYATDIEEGAYFETAGGLELGEWLKTYATPTKRTLGAEKGADLRGNRNGSGVVSYYENTARNADFGGGRKRGLLEQKRGQIGGLYGSAEKSTGEQKSASSPVIYGLLQEIEKGLRNLASPESSPEGIRTPNPGIMSPLLSPLSYQARKI